MNSLKVITTFTLNGHAPSRGSVRGVNDAIAFSEFDYNGPAPLRADTHVV